MSLFTRFKGRHYLNTNEAADLYEELRGAAFPRNSECREHCVAFNGLLHDIHNSAINGEIAPEEAIEFASKMQSVDCEGPKRLRETIAAVFVDCGIEIQ